MNRLPGLLKIILVTLPFTSSVTLPVGFPLKIYELVGLVAVFGMFAAGQVNLAGRSRVPMLWLLFLFGTLFPAAYGLQLITDQRGSLLEWATGRYNPLVNTLFHYVYLAFDIFLLVLVVDLLGKGRISTRQFVRFWLIGTCLAVAYAVLLNLVTMVGLSPQLLLRWDEVQYMTIGGVNIARTGPFKEGNYFGLYLLLSMVLALWASQQYRERFYTWLVPIIALGALITASPAAILGLLVLVVVAMLMGWGTPMLRLATAGGSVLVVVILVQSGLLLNFVDKFSLILFGGVTDTRNVSMVQRLNESYHAWLMFLDHPWGIGIGNFGYLFGKYPDLYTWMQSDFVSLKHIVNNVYLEVLVEHGIILFGVFVYILAFQAQRLALARQWLILIGFGLLCGYFLVFPTYRLSLIWVFWGFVIWIGQPLVSAAAAPSPPPSPPLPSTPSPSGDNQGRDHA